MHHILILPSWYPSNPSDVAGVFFRDQALALSRYGHRVGVVSVEMHSIRHFWSFFENKKFTSYEIDEGIPTYRSKIIAALPKIPYGNYFLWKYSASLLINRYIHEHGRPDIIHSHAAIYAGASAVSFGKKHNIPVVLTEHSTGFARNTYSMWQLKIAEYAAINANTCIAVSPSLGENLNKILPRSRDRWLFVPNIVSKRFFVSCTERYNKPVRFFNLAIMTETKGQFDLLQGFTKAYGRIQNIELWMGGDGPLRPLLEKLAKELNIAHCVRFLGQIPPEEVPRLLSQTDVMVVSSHYETFGVVAAEALMSGRPVIATRCGGPEYIVGEKDGLLVSPKSPDQLAEALCTMATNIAKFSAKDLAERAKTRFGEAAVAAQLSSIYEGISPRKHKA